MSRVQAQYAAQAGIIYALEQLRTGNWIAGVNCVPGNPCLLPMAPNEFPDTVNSIDIVIDPAASPLGDAISVTVDYVH